MLPILLFDNRFNDGVPTATDTAAGFSVLNIRDLRTFTYYKANSLGTKIIKVNCGSAKSADCLGIINHNLGTVGATISVEGSNDDFGADIVTALAGFTVNNDKAILKLFPASLQKQYWRLSLANCTAAPQLAVAMIGMKLQFPYPPETTYVPYKESIEADSKLSKGAHTLGTVVRYKPRKISARFANLSRPFVFDTFVPFWDGHASDKKPFFYAWDLDAFPEHVMFVRVPDNYEFETPLTTGALVDAITLDMEGVKE